MAAYLARIDRNQLQRGRIQNVVHGGIVLGAMILLLAAVGWLLGGPTGVLLLSAMGTALALFNPRVSGSLILRLQGSVPIHPTMAPELSRALDVLSRRAGLEVRPRLFRVPVRGATAMAVGTRADPAIGVTDRLLRSLTLRELAGVLAHEVSHIQRNDTRVLGLAGVLSQTTSFMSLIGQFLVLLNIPLLLLGEVTISWAAILLLMLAPGLSGSLQLTLSRTREYAADLGAVQLTGDPWGLASALNRLEQLNRSVFDRFFPGAGRIPIPKSLRTHPGTEERVKRLMELDGDPSGQWRGGAVRDGKASSDGLRMNPSRHLPSRRKGSMPARESSELGLSPRGIPESPPTTAWSSSWVSPPRTSRPRRASRAPSLSRMSVPVARRFDGSEAMPRARQAEVG